MFQTQQGLPLSLLFFWGGVPYVFLACIRLFVLQIASVSLLFYPSTYSNRLLSILSLKKRSSIVHYLYKNGTLKTPRQCPCPEAIHKQ